MKYIAFLSSIALVCVLSSQIGEATGHEWIFGWWGGSLGMMLYYEIIVGKK